MQELLIGLGVLIMGMLLVFGGYRFARILLPIWGFIAGFSLGAAVTADISSAGFLGTVLGIGVGLGVGTLFAVLIYAYFYVAIILAGAMLGYWVGASFIRLFGIDPGLLSVSAGIVTGIAFALAGIFTNLPRALLIIGTSIAGATAVIGGMMLMVDYIPLEFFSYQAVRLTIADSALWVTGAFALAVVGGLTQFLSTRRYDVDEWALGENESDHHHTTHHTPTATHA